MLHPVVIAFRGDFNGILYASDVAHTHAHNSHEQYQSTSKRKSNIFNAQCKLHNNRLVTQQCTASLFFCLTSTRLRHFVSPITANNNKHKLVGLFTFILQNSREKTSYIRYVGANTVARTCGWARKSNPSIHAQPSSD